MIVSGMFEISSNAQPFRLVQLFTVDQYERCACVESANVYAAACAELVLARDPTLCPVWVLPKNLRQRTQKILGSRQPERPISLRLS